MATIGHHKLKGILLAIPQIILDLDYFKLLEVLKIKFLCVLFLYYTQLLPTSIISIIISCTYNNGCVPDSDHKANPRDRDFSNHLHLMTFSPRP